MAAPAIALWVGGGPTTRDGWEAASWVATVVGPLVAAASAEPNRPHVRPDDLNRQRAVWSAVRRLPYPLFAGTFVAMIAAVAIGVLWDQPVAAGLCGAAAVVGCAVGWWRRMPQLPAAVLAVAPPETKGGLEYSAAEPGELTRVYTAQELGESLDRDRLSNDATRAGDRSAQELRMTIDQVIKARGGGHIVVTGEPGVGKSSLLEYVESTAWTWWRTATRAASRSTAPFGNVLPLRIAARDLVGKPGVESGFSPPVARLLENPPPAGLSWLVMVDAVDEIVRTDDWRQVMDLLIAAIRKQTHGPAIQYLITTRGLHDRTWRNLTDAGATEYRLQPFSLPQLQRFVIAHQSAGSRRLKNPAVRAAAESKAKEFVSYMQSSGMLDVVRLPLLAYLAANQYFDGYRASQAPARRVDIYARAVEEFLNRFPEGRIRDDVKTGDEVGVVLDRVQERYAPGDMTAALEALLSYAAHSYLTEDANIVVSVAEALEIPPHQHDSPAFRALTAFLDATGLVVDTHSQRPRFFHQTLAEYLAAPYTRDRYGTDVAAWNAALADIESRFAAVFAFERHGPRTRDAIARALADVPDGRVQAGWLAAEGVCDAQTQDYVIERLWQAPPDGPLDSWWEPVTALAHVPRNARELHELANDDHSHPDLRIAAAAALATHSHRGQDVLRDIATSQDVDGKYRVDAADRLARFDSSTALDLLRRLSADPTSSHAVYAASRLALHAREGHDLLRRIADDAARPHEDRVDSAIALARFDRDAGLSRLRGFAIDADLVADLRVSAAIAIAASDADAGAVHLEQLALDHALDPACQVRAASGLAEYRREEGVAILEWLATMLRGPARLEVGLALVSHNSDAAWPLLRSLAEDPGLDARDRSKVSAVVKQADRDSLDPRGAL